MLAPDDPKWLHRDDDLKPPTQAWIHRAHYVGPSGGRPADALHGTTGVERYATQARLFGRRLLLPDENVTWALTAIPAAVRLVREREDRRVLTTSPPGSVHLVGAAVQRLTGGALGRRSPRLAARAPAPARRARSRVKAKERSRGRRGARRAPRRRDRRCVGGDRRGDARRSIRRGAS